MTKPAICRIDGIVAREAPIAVIFRRGPSKQTQLLTWNLETDVVTPGQWIKAKVYTRRCDISPDGKYLVAAFTDYSSRRDPAVEKFGLKDEYLACGWTAISKPPYFTALGLWFSGDAWNGGGYWDGPNVLRANIDTTWHEAISPKGAPFKVRKLNWGGCEDEPLFGMRLERQGWVTESSFEVEMTNKRAVNAFARKSIWKLPALLRGDWQEMSEFMASYVAPEWRMLSAGSKSKRFSGGALRFEKWLDPGKAAWDPSERWSICDGNGIVRRDFKPKSHHPQFLDMDPRGRVVFGDKGCLWAWDEFPKGKPQLIADLNANRFEPVEAPDWARTW